MTVHAWKATLTPGSFEAYCKAHAEMPPEMVTALRLAGFQQYRIFAHQSGDLFGSFQCDDLAALQQRMARAAANEDWQRRMAPLLRRDIDPATGFPRLMTKVFDLDDHPSARPR